MLLFRSEETVDRWCEAHQVPRRPLVSLEQHGWVRRERHADDGRVVLVSLTQEGRRTLEGFRAQVLDALRSQLDAMPDEEIAELEAATATLGSLVDALQAAPGNARPARKAESG